MALVHILMRLARPRKWTLEVLHFDHGLRGEESDGDRRFVEELASRHGLPCHVERANVRAAARGANLEQTARQMRYGFFAAVRERRGLDVVATGHTASDQAETVLMRLLRGAGAESLAGIRPVNDGWVVRPLIEVTREQVRQWLRGEGLEWREDSSNSEMAFDRNRVRHELLPLLRREWNPAVDEALARLAAAAARDEEFWEAQAETVWHDAVRVSHYGVLVDTEAMQGVPTAVRIRVLKRACMEALGTAPRLEAEHLEALLKLARQKSGTGKASLPGLEAWRSYRAVLIYRQGTDFERPPAVQLAVPGVAALEECGPRFRLRRAAAGARFAARRGYWLDGTKAPGPFTLRAWQEGDAYWPNAYVRRYSLQELMEKLSVPAWERPAWPVLEWNGEVVWTRGHAVAREFAAGRDCAAPVEIVQEPVPFGG